MMAEISLQRSPVASERLGRGRSTLHEDVRRGTMPPPIKGNNILDTSVIEVDNDAIVSIPGAASIAEDDMAWAEPQYLVQEVNAAGKGLVKFFADPNLERSPQAWAQYNTHLAIINNWRASHNYPLNTFQINLRKTARKFDQDPLVAQRIKRLISIWLKLDRSPSMKLSQMQDIGGCRAVLSSVEQVLSLVNYYSNESRIKHVPGPVDDYISTPKPSGYRGIHLMYRYKSDKKKTVYNDLKIEMQIRSRYQHAWATAVETAGIFVGQALKTSLGDDQWLRFFALMGSAIAIREKTPTAPNTPTSRKGLIDELSDLANSLDVANRLNGYANALRYINNDVENAHWYLLQLDPKAMQLVVSGFKLQEREEAERRYAEAESKIREYPGTDAVLVSVESASALQKAYPNYFADTEMFVQLLTQALSGRTREIRASTLKAAGND